MEMSKDELIAYLQSLPDDTLLLVASDEEWNRLRTFYRAEKALVITDSSLGYSAINEDDRDSFEDEQVIEAVVFWG